MIDKINNINASNAQNKREIEERQSRASSLSKVVAQKETGKNIDIVKINSSTDNIEMAKSAPVDIDKVSAIKNAISKGNYPINLEKVADALLEAYKDIK